MSFIILSVPSIYFANNVFIKLSSLPNIILSLVSLENKYELLEVLFLIKLYFDE